MGAPWDFQFDDISGDSFLDAGNQIAVTTTMADIIAVRIQTRLRTILGENFRNRETGVPYFEEVLKKNPDMARVKNLLLSAMANVEGVRKILQFDPILEPETRTYRVYFKVLASNDEEVEGTI